MLLHRWPALILGLFLVVETTTGAVLLYHGEIFRATNNELYSHSASANRIEPDQAIDIVAKAEPAFPASWVAKDDGVYVVGDNTYSELYFVDPAGGQINGHTNLDKGFFGWMINLHDCGFSCEGLPWYTAWFSTPVWDGGPSLFTGITRGGLILGVLGVLLILLVLSSLKIWWPGIKRLGTRFTVRRGKGRFARDFDLHNVIGAIALPFLLMWGVTGAAFEFPGVEKAWLAITGGHSQPEQDFSITPTKVAPGTPALTYDEATSFALDKVPGEAVWVGRPTKDVPYWEIDVKTGYGSSDHRLVYRGDTYVLLDAHDTSNFKVIESAQGEPAANRFYDKYLEPAHLGWQVNGWWRIIWFIMGMTPLILMITGISTWLYRRGVKKRRKQAGKARLDDTALDPDLLDRPGELDSAALDPGDEHEPTAADEQLRSDDRGVLHGAEQPADRT